MAQCVNRSPRWTRYNVGEGVKRRGSLARLACSQVLALFVRLPVIRQLNNIDGPTADVCESATWASDRTEQLELVLEDVVRWQLPQQRFANRFVARRFGSS